MFPVEIAYDMYKLEGKMSGFGGAQFCIFISHSPSVNFSVYMG